MKRYDVSVVGSGPNGLAAAIYLARAGLTVRVIEGAAEPGGGLRSAELTQVGFVHDVCAAALPLGIASPFLAGLPLAEHGLRWLHPELPLAQALDDGDAVHLERDLQATVAALGADGPAYRRLVGPLVAARDDLLAAFLGPLPLPDSPRAALAAARFGLPALASAQLLATAAFRGERARALFAGLAAHAIQPPGRPATAAFALVLALLAHGEGWPLVEGGSGRLARALVAHFRSLGGEIETGRWVRSADELDDSRFVLLDMAPNAVIELLGERIGGRYRRALRRYRYGPGVFKLDLALAGPVPWTAEACRRAGTVHVGGGFEEVAAAERLVWRGVHPEKPFVIVTQPSLFDPTRAPAGRHTLWAYCHVPNGSDVDMTESVLRQLERYAPCVRELVLMSHARTARQYQAYDPNFVGGDINVGVQDLAQLFTRPVPRLDPYSTPDERFFLCSSATPPGGGVHGMCGVGAARSLLRRLESGT